MKNTLTTLLLMTSFSGLASSALAHHGPGQFNGGDVTVTGNITNVRFVNPHGYIYFDAKDANGDMESWRCELQAGSLLRRAGWDEALFPIGGEVTVTGSAGTKERTACALQSVILPDGRSLSRSGQLRDVVDNNIKTETKFADGVLNLNGTWAAPQRSLQSSNGGGGMGRGRGGRGALPNGLSLTGAGTTAVATYQTETGGGNPRHRCESSNIFADWTFDRHVNEIIQTDNTITMKYGMMDIVRTIHLDMDEHPNAIKPSKAGHSIGRLEGTSLVVDTIGFMNGGYLSGGLIYSDKFHVKENFTYKAEDNSLTRTYTATDSDNFTGTYSGEDVIYVSNTPFEAYECVELMDDYIAPVDGVSVDGASAGGRGISTNTPDKTSGSPVFKYLGGLGLLFLGLMAALVMKRRSSSS